MTIHVGAESQILSTSDIRATHLAVVDGFAFPKLSYLEENALTNRQRDSRTTDLNHFLNRLVQFCTTTADDAVASSNE